jgi:hypothetical protein
MAELPGHVIFRCDSDPTRFLTPLRRLPGFEMRQTRVVEGIIATFEIVPGVRTIANLLGEQVLDLRKMRHPGDFENAKRRVLDAASEGRLWWGTERLVGLPDLTSVCYIFSEEELLGCSIKKRLYADEASSQLQTTLNLV